MTFDNDFVIKSKYHLGCQPRLSVVYYSTTRLSAEVTVVHYIVQHGCQPVRFDNDFVIKSKYHQNFVSCLFKQLKS